MCQFPSYNMETSTALTMLSILKIKTYVFEATRQDMLGLTVPQMSHENQYYLRENFQ